MSWLIPSLPRIPYWSRAPGESNPDEDLDIPPPFPLPNSSQRSAPAPKPPHTTSTSMPPPPAPSMPPPPPPSFSIAPPSPPRQDEPASDLHIAILPDATPLGDMAPPPRTTKKPSFGIQPGGEDESQLGQLGSDGHLGSNGETGQKKNVKAKGKGGKVALGPGFSALDWARLTSSGRDLRGPGGPFPKRVTMDELKQHTSRTDAWSVFNGKVYNITPYLPFHPGGRDELMRVAGRDGTRLFMLTHSWVNLEYMLQECLVGILVRG